jgi:hypothetical protein
MTLSITTLGMKLSAAECRGALVSLTTFTILKDAVKMQNAEIICFSNCAAAEINKIL